MTGARDRSVHGFGLPRHIERSDGGLLRRPGAPYHPDLAALLAFLDARADDPLCVAPVRHRFVVTPDPLLDVGFAASAWGHSLRLTCLDLEVLGVFIDAHDGNGTEATCTDGFDSTDLPTGVPTDCP